MFIAIIRLFSFRIYPVLFPLLLALLLSACGGSGSSSSNNNPTQTPDPVPNPDPAPDPAPDPDAPPVSDLVVNPISNAYFLDEDSAIGKIAGSIIVETTSANSLSADQTLATTLVADLLNASGEVIESDWLEIEVPNHDAIEIPAGTAFVAAGNQLAIYGLHEGKRSAQKLQMPLRDFYGNSLMTGPGGNAEQNWFYGTDRAKIAIHRDDDNGRCYLDNGWVRIIDMQDQWPTDQSPVPVDDGNYSAYQFSCVANPLNEERAIYTWENELWSYSLFNDAMFYGTETFRVLTAFLPAHAMDDKLRIRVHLRPGFTPGAFWDGGYMNFFEGDAGTYRSQVSLDIIAHEAAHGILDNLAPQMNGLQDDITLSFAAASAHEAFADITGFFVKYKFFNEKLWRHSQEANYRTRLLSSITTEAGAVDSALDLDDADDNQYLINNTLTYPFYLLAENWGVEAAYRVYVNSTQFWQPDYSVQQFAQSILQAANQLGYSASDVITAFKTMKVSLNDDLLAHFEYDTAKLRVNFSDDSRSNNASASVTAWLWDFGDGKNSTEQSPLHIYASSGSYQVQLTSTDSRGQQDIMQRTVTVTDQYCQPYTTSAEVPFITALQVDGQDLNYQDGKFDYSTSIIQVQNKASVAINIQGNRNGQQRPIEWKAWLDWDDDGRYEEIELIETERFSDQDPYGWQTTLGVSAIKEGQSAYLRIAGSYVNIGPCSHNVGQLIEVKLQ